MLIKITLISYTFPRPFISVKFGIGPLSLLFHSILRYPTKTTRDILVLISSKYARVASNKMGMVGTATYRTWSLVRLFIAGTRPVKLLLFRRLYSKSTSNN